jgi:hypothetical protein
MHNIHKASLALVISLGAATAQASTITLPLGNLKSGANIDNYFVGGNDSVPSDGTGPNLGFTFSSNATAQKPGTTSTSDGRFENEPSTQGEVLFFSPSTTVTSTIDFAGGFTGLSFDYSVSANNANLGSTAAYSSATAELWSGLNGTGSLLDTLTLTPVSTPVSCLTHGDAFCNWSLASTTGASFGAAESVTFSANSTGATEFDDVQLTPSPVPLPAAAWLLMSGLAGLGGMVRRRRQSL